MTKREQDFIAVYVDTGNREYAEEKAGYRPGGGYLALRRPDVQAEVLARQEARMSCELLPLALDTVEEILRNGKAPAAARIQAAKLVLDKQWPENRNGEGGKEAHEMSSEEIAREIAKLEGAAADKAKDASPIEDAQVVNKASSSPFD